MNPDKPNSLSQGIFSQENASQIKRLPLKQIFDLSQVICYNRVIVFFN